MTLAELNQFQTMLNTKFSELAQTGGKREGIRIERTADALDEVQLAAQRELTTRNLDRESKLLRNVRVAQGRIVDGTYGVCQSCEEEISQKRLRAVPWATLCIGCQQQQDRSEEPGAEFAPQQWSLKEAA